MDMMNSHKKPNREMDDMLQYIEAKWMHITNPHENYEDKTL